MNDVNIRTALRAGVKLSIGTDAHNVDELRYYELGIATARRGWAEKKDVINSYFVGYVKGFEMKILGNCP